jgi:methionyl-tRNA formyltransferase
MSVFNRIIFLGSPAFAVPSLKRLTESEKYKPIAVITQPDRPSGRKLQLQPTPVKLLALEHNIPVLQPEDINSAEVIDQIRALSPDLLVTVAYGSKLKKAVRQSASYGAINLHPSLLPELRGAAPIPFALWNGMIQTGITIFQLTARMDAGPVYVKKPFYIFPSEQATDLAERLAHLGSKLLLQFLQDFSNQPWQPEPQNEQLATYCRKIDKDDCLIDWHKPAPEIQNQIRALSLTPGAYTLFRNQPLKIIDADVINLTSDLPAGTVSAVEKNAGFSIQTASGQLLVKAVQPSGKKIMSAWAFHLGSRIEAGERMGINEQ